METTNNQDRLLPLTGIRVIEFCHVAAGPFCGMLLADIGADLIKVEPAGGDSMRNWPPITHGYSENFASINRNKRSVVLDLKSSKGLAAARVLCDTADVVIENNRPGVMQRLGLDYSSLAATNPRLVYCSISAFGQTGPRAQSGGFDVAIQAISGVMSVTGEPGRPPVKAGVPISDFAAGLYAAFSIVSALKARDTTGAGTFVDVSMQATTLAIGALQTSEYFGNDQDPTKLGSAHPRNAPYAAFPANDGHFVLAAGNDKLWQTVCEKIERPDLLADTRFKTTMLRAQNQEFLRELLEVEFARQSTDHWISLLSEAGVPCCPINSYSQALSDPQIVFQDLVQPITLPGGHATKTVASPIRMDGRGFPITRMPPSLGEHTTEVLHELGLKP